MAPKNYDFCGWVTKNDLRCSDGRTIHKDSFAHQDGAKVPLGNGDVVLPQRRVDRRQLHFASPPSSRPEPQAEWRNLIIHNSQFIIHVKSPHRAYHPGGEVLMYHRSDCGTEQ